MSRYLKTNSNKANYNEQTLNFNVTYHSNYNTKARTKRKLPFNLQPSRQNSWTRSPRKIPQVSNFYRHPQVPSKDSQTSGTPREHPHSPLSAPSPWKDVTTAYHRIISVFSTRNAYNVPGEVQSSNLVGQVSPNRRRPLKLIDSPESWRVHFRARHDIVAPRGHGPRE